MDLALVDWHSTVPDSFLPPLPCTLSLSFIPSFQTFFPFASISPILVNFHPYLNRFQSAHSPTVANPMRHYPSTLDFRPNR